LEKISEPFLERGHPKKVNGVRGYINLSKKGKERGKKGKVMGESEKKDGRRFNNYSKRRSG